jgi:hypothetical protein
MVKLDKAVETVNGDLERRTRIFLDRQNVPAVRRVTVSASQGAVKLRGRVGSFHERQLCVNCCQHVAGVMRVIDEIEVEYKVTRRPR